MSAQTVQVSRSIARGNPRLLLVTLMLGQMSQSLAFTAFVAALPQMAGDLGSRGQFVAQMTMALAALGLMLGSILSGWILEKCGTRATLLTSSLIFGLTGAAGMFVRDPSLLLASRFILGFASACMATTCMWGISAEYDGNRRAGILGMSAAVSNFVALGTTILGGYLAARGGWRLTFVQYPIFGLMACLLSYLSMKQARPERELAGAVSQPFLMRLLPFYSLVLVLFVVMFMSSTQFAFILVEDGIRNPETRSLFMAVVTMVAAVTSFVYGPLQRWLTILGAFAFGLTCMAFGLAVVGLGVGPVYAVLGASLMGLYIGVLGPYVYHHVSEHTDSFTRSRAIGLLSAFGFLGGFLNPLVLSPMSDAIGLRNAFLLVAFVMAVLALGGAIRVIRQRGALRARPNAA